MPTMVSLQLDQLTCGNETEGGAEPYIWPIFIAEENGIASVHLPLQEIAGTPLKNNMRGGESVAIPQGLNLIEHTFENPDAGLAVFIITLFEKDASPFKGTRAVFNHISERSLAFVRDHLAECRQANGNRGDLRAQLVSSFDLGGAEISALSLLERAAIKFSSGGFDDSIGFAFQTFSGSGISARNLTFDLSSSSESFTLTGSMGRKLILRLRCQDERDALAHAEAVVKGLQLQRKSLQEQLHHATPQQKPAFIDMITKIAEVDLPAAEAEVLAAKAALEACEANFPHGPLDSPVIMG